MPNVHLVIFHSFLFQFLFAFFSFVFPGADSGTRSRMAPYHVFFGIVIFLMAIISAETGLVERFIFLGLRRSQEALIMNFTGLLILLFGIAVSFAVILPRRYWYCQKKSGLFHLHFILLITLLWPVLCCIVVYAIFLFFILKIIPDVTRRNHKQCWTGVQFIEIHLVFFLFKVVVESVLINTQWRYKHAHLTSHLLITSIIS